MLEFNLVWIAMWKHRSIIQLSFALYALIIWSDTFCLKTMDFLIEQSQICSRSASGHFFRCFWWYRLRFEIIKHVHILFLAGRYTQAVRQARLTHSEADCHGQAWLISGLRSWTMSSRDVVTCWGRKLYPHADFAFKILSLGVFWIERASGICLSMVVLWPLNTL